MEVYKTGTEIETIIGNIKGIITAICIRQLRVNYELSYFNKDGYKTCWISEDEFIVKENTGKIKIGFKNK
jgi:hypothetical protein